MQQVMRDDEATDRVISHHAPGIADDVRVARLKARQVLHVEPRVHACHHRHALGRLDRLLTGVGRFVLQSIRGSA